MNKNTGLTHIGKSIKFIMDKLRRKDKVHIKAKTTTDYQVVNGNGDVIIEDCPILSLNNDRRCIRSNCPFNSSSCCEEIDPPGIYDFKNQKGRC